MYCGNWSPESDQVIYADGKNLVIKPLKSGLKPCNWAAHDGLVLCLDWSPANGLIVSGGEDSKYKVKIVISPFVMWVFVHLKYDLVPKYSSPHVKIFGQ